MSQFLFDLVKSLSKSEKIYFKRNAKTHAEKDDKNYLMIYNFVEGMKTYDKDAIANHFKGSTIEKYLSSELNYVSDKILLTLSNYNLNKSTGSQIEKGILMLEVLADKGFRKMALKKLKVLKQKALKQEELTLIFRLIEMEENILFKQGTVGYKDKLRELHEQRDQINRVIQNINNYHLLRQEVRELQFSEHVLHPDMSTLSEFCENPLVKSIDNCLSQRAKEHWYYINVLTSYLNTDFETGLAISSDYVNFMNENTHLFDNSVILPVLSNYIYHAALTRNKNHFENGKTLLFELSQKQGVSEFYIKYISYTRNLEFGYYTNNHNLIREYLTLTSDMVKNNSDEFEEVQIQYLYLIILKSAIVLRDLTLGKHYSNLFQQRGVLPFRKVQAKLFSIIIHFESGYMDLVQSEIITLKKLIKNNPSEKELIESFYRFFNALIKHPSRKSKLLKQLHKELKMISENKKTSFSFVFFDYYKWSLTIAQEDVRDS